MTAITEANAKKLIKSMPFFRQQSRDGLEGWWKWLENFDDTTGAITVTVDDTIAGTEAALFTVGIASGDTPRISLASPDGAKTGDYILSVTPGTLADDQSVWFPDSLGADDVIVTEAMTQTLALKTLTAPTIADFTNATHDHADAAGGGTISTTVSGTTSDTFTINNGAAVETEIAITSAGTTGGFTATLAIPTLAADRTITFPAVTCTLASVTGTETLTNKTLTSPSMTLPTIADGLLASGSVSNDFSTSTGTFKTSSGANTLSGDVTIAAGKDLTMSSTATITTGTGAIALNGAVTMATTKGITFGSASAGIATALTMYSLTGSKGALILAVADATGNFATTITNGDALAATTITLPNATTTLSGLAINETVTGDKVHIGTLDIRGNVSASASDPNVDLSGSTGTFLTPTGAVTIGNGAVEVTGALTLTGGIVETIDTASGTDLAIAPATATSLTLGASDITTAVSGALTVLGGIDTGTDAALTVGAATATSLTLGAVDIVTTLKGIVKGDAEGYMTHTLVVDATVVEINAGHVLVTCPAGRQLQLVDVVAVAYGGAIEACDTVDIIEETSTTKFVTFAQTDLTQSTTLTMAANGTDIADGASYSAMTADKDILVSHTGSDATTATGVRFIISYIIV